MLYIKNIIRLLLAKGLGHLWSLVYPLFTAVSMSQTFSKPHLPDKLVSYERNMHALKSQQLDKMLK